MTLKIYVHVSDIHLNMTLSGRLISGSFVPLQCHVILLHFIYTKEANGLAIAVFVCIHHIIFVLAKRMVKCLVVFLPKLCISFL